MSEELNLNLYDYRLLAEDIKSLGVKFSIETLLFLKSAFLVFYIYELNKFNA